MQWVRPAPGGAAQRAAQRHLDAPRQCVMWRMGWPWRAAGDAPAANSSSRAPAMAAPMAAEPQSNPSLADAVTVGAGAGVRMTMRCVVGVAWSGAGAGW